MTSPSLTHLTWCFGQLFDKFHRSADGGPVPYRNPVFHSFFVLVNKARRINNNQAVLGGDLYNPVEWPKVRNIPFNGVFGEAS